MPRFLYGLDAGRRKARILATLQTMIISGALPEHGQKRYYQKEVSQAELAAMSGLGRRDDAGALLKKDGGRSTFNRRLVRLYIALGGGVAKERREQRSVSDVAKVSGSTPDSLTIPILSRARNFSRPNSYRFAGLPRALCPAGCVDLAKCEHCRHGCANRAICGHSAPADDEFYPPTVKMLRAHPALRPFFAEDAPRGFKDQPVWVDDPKLPLGESARLVLRYYIDCGLFDPLDKHEIARRRSQKITGLPVSFKVRGVCFARQTTVAQACGISVSTVHRANKRLETVLPLRVAHTPAKCDPVTNQWRSGPQRVLWLPALTFTAEEAHNQRLRLLEVARLRRTAANAHWVDLVLNLHVELAATYIGTQRKLGSFWRELRLKAIAAGMNQGILLDAMVPKPPP